MWMSLLLLMVGCRTEKEPVDVETDDPIIETDTALDTDTGDTDTDDTDGIVDDPIEEGRTGMTFCSSGGFVEGNSFQGSFCFGAVDLTAPTEASSPSFQWQPGPTYTVSP